MHSFRLIVADVDGTLIPPASSHTTKLSDRLIASVSGAQAAGVSFSLASARSLDWVEQIVVSLSLTAPIILDNGARIWDCSAKRYLFETFIPDHTIPAVLSLLSKFPYPVHSAADGVRVTYAPSSPPPLSRVSKLMILHLAPEPADAVYQALRRISDIQVTKSISGAHPTVESIHVTALGARKDIALCFVMARLAVSAREVIGIGDSYNDREFLMACGMKVAMGNAVSEIQRIADYIAPPYDQDGVAEVIERFVLKKNTYISQTHV